MEFSLFFFHFDIWVLSLIFIFFNFSLTPLILFYSLPFLFSPPSILFFRRVCHIFSSHDTKKKQRKKYTQQQRYPQIRR